VLGLVFGLLAAFSWGSGAVVATRQVRIVGTRRSLGWVALLGLLFVCPALLFVPFPSAGASSWAFGALSGLAYIAGWTFWSLAIRSGNISLVTPIVSTDGAIAAVIAVVALGEVLHTGVAVALGVIVAGIVITGIPRGAGGHGQFTGRQLLLALAAAGAFAVSFVAGGEAEALGVVWTLVVSRITAVIVMLPALVSPGAFRLPRSLIPWVVATSALDLVGYAFFLLGAQHGVAIAAVLASQYAMVAVIGGLLVYRERLTPLQGLGVLTTMVGVAMLAVFRG
jgi:drug/metabolite transporter (DMT)-like permease